MIKKLLSHKDILHNFSYMYLIVVVQRLMGFAATYFLVRVLSENQFAEYTLIISYLSLFTSLSLSGLADAVLQSTAREKNDFYYKATKLKFAGTCIAGLCLVIFAHLQGYAENASDSTYYALILAAILFPFYSGITLWRQHRAGLQQFKQISLFTNLSNIFMYLVTILILLYHDVQDYIILIAAYMVVPVLINVAVTVVDYGKYMKRQQEDYDEGMVEYGLKNSLYTSIHSLALRLDHFLLFYLISPQALAFFAVANKVPEMLRGVNQTLGSVLAPKFAKSRAVTPTIKKSIQVYSLLSGVVILTLTFTIYPFFMNFLFGETYADAIIYSQVLMCIVVIGNGPNIYFRYIRSQQDSKSFRNIVLVTSLIKIASVITFVPLWGLWGAIGSIFVHRMATWITVEYIIKKKYLAS